MTECSKCGTKLEGAEKFCRKCGAKIDIDEVFIETKYHFFEVLASNRILKYFVLAFVTFLFISLVFTSYQYYNFYEKFNIEKGEKENYISLFNTEKTNKEAEIELIANLLNNGTFLA